MPDWTTEHDRAARKRAGMEPSVNATTEALSKVLDSGSRRREGLRDLLDDVDQGDGREYRKRSPTNSERLNRALVELGSSAVKVHTLVWKWRGAPARGTLPYFTIRSLEKFCNLTRPTIRKALVELSRKGWIVRRGYNKYHKNTLYSLVPIRKVPAPIKEQRRIM